MGLLTKPKKSLLILLSLVILCLAYFFITKSTDLLSSESVDDDLRVHFIDVGQGDAALLQGPDFTILVDAGRHDRNDVVPYLLKQNIQQIDLLIGTHPHADHIGQFPEVLAKFEVNEVWMSGDLHTTLTFERALDAIEQTNAKYNEPRANETYKYGSSIIEVLHPIGVMGDLNNGSIVLRISFYDIVFLFTGDAELNTENEILDRGKKLDSDIIKIGHHGSISSTSELFLSEIRPKIAIYSASVDNSYGHPDPVIIDRLNSAGAKVYGTDLNGTVVLTTDGKTYEIEVSKMNSKEFSESTSCIDINTANKNTLIDIVNIGSKRADQLIQMRPISSVDQLTMINGIGYDRLSEIKKQGLICLN